MWLKVVDCKRDGTNTRLRTRRPLPPVVDQTQSKWFKASAAKAKANEMKPEITNRSQESHSVKWVLTITPLEAQLNYIEHTVPPHP